MRVQSGNPGVVLSDKDPSGVRLHAGHVHRELRRVLGVDKADFAAKFPLPVTDLALPLLA
jgi:hypothetical protein